jgi:hypothetical protein
MIVNFDATTFFMTCICITCLCSTARMKPLIQSATALGMASPYTLQTPQTENLEEADFHTRVQFGRSPLWKARQLRRRPLFMLQLRDHVLKDLCSCCNCAITCSKTVQVTDDARVRFISRGQNPARATETPSTINALMCVTLREELRSSCARVRKTSNGCVANVAANPAAVLQANVRAALGKPSASFPQERFNQS